MTVQCITDITESPIVGRFYLVPCVRYWYRGRVAWWPVMGPKHEDAEHLNFTQVHYHLDRRFMSPKWFHTPRFVKSEIWPLGRMKGDPHFCGDTIIAARPLGEFGAGTGHCPGADGGGPLPAPVLRRRKCYISDVGFPELSRSGETFLRFHRAFEGRACKRDAEGHLVCPHKGARLSSLVPDKAGRVICPLHGLMINVETGRVVKRPGGAA